jgi:signal transduction histidine kinase
MLIDLLEISRIGSDDPPLLESVDVRTLCLDAVHIRNLPEALVLGQSAMIRTDTRRFERILGNLIDNANRHGGGVTAIGIDRLTEGDSDVVSVYVEDNGPGIPHSEVTKLFEPFTRGEAAKETSGAGLGLAIASEQSHLLGISLRVEAAPGGGARFVIDIPVSEHDELFGLSESDFT